MRTIMKGVHGIAALGHFFPVTKDMNHLASKENRIKRCQSGLTRSPSGHADSEFLAFWDRYCITISMSTAVAPVA